MPTIPDPLYDPDGRVSLAVYDYLDEATPEERTEMVLRLIEEHPDGRLELPERDGKTANLQDVDLGLSAITARLDGQDGPPFPKWAGTWHYDDHDGHNRRCSVQLTRALLSGASLGGANLHGAGLAFADLEGADISEACLDDANLFEANLQGADILETSLRNAELNWAHLEGLNLSANDLSGVFVQGAWLSSTRFRPSQLGRAIGEERVEDLEAARNGYLILKQNFESLSDYESASWAYKKERRMEKLEALRGGHMAEKAGNWPKALKHYGKAALDQLVELICDYGESFWRVLICLAVIWFDFALLYAITGDVLADRGAQYVTTRNLFDLASFSLGTMVTIEPPGLIAYDSLLMRIAMPLQAFIGIFLAGLLGFVAGNRIRRS